MNDNTCIVCGKIIPEGGQLCLHCGQYDESKPPKPVTFGDKLRHMTDEELGKYLARLTVDCLSANCCVCQFCDEDGLTCSASSIAKHLKKPLYRR